MDTTTAKLIESLAQKLGTTSEYLWRVLMKQAPISSTVDLIIIIGLIISGIILYKLHRKFSKPYTDQKYSENMYEDLEALVVIPMAFAAMLWGILVIIYFTCIGDIVTGYLNPEYWALHEVLKQIK